MWGLSMPEEHPGLSAWRAMSAREKIEAVKPLALEDQSAGQIAAALGVSRNAVIGVVYRSNGAVRLANRRQETGTKRRRRRRARSEHGAKAALVRTKKQPIPMDPALADELENSPTWRPLPGSEPVGLLERTGCAWPVTVEGRTLFCNCAIEKGARYCADHAAIHQKRGRP